MTKTDRPTRKRIFRCQRMYLSRGSGYVFVTGNYYTLETGKWYAYDTDTFYGPFPCREAARTTAKLLMS